ncbi:MAG: CoA-transferase, partial [Elusimicrobiota bacterium]
MNKKVESADAAVAKVFDGAMIMIGGFGGGGLPENLL